MTTETVEQTTNEPAPPPNGPAVHLARCATCDFSLRFKAISQHSYEQLDYMDRSFGIGDHGRPCCPNGHGEMEVADDRLPIEQAVEHALEQLDAATQRLPFPVPPFNYAGVLQALVDKRHEVAKLEKKVNDRKDLLKAAKDELDEVNKQLGRMIDQFEHDEQDRLAETSRREARAAAGHPEETNLVRCLWEEQHPGEACPICSDADLEPTVAKDSAAHLEEIADLLILRDCTLVEVALEEARIVIESTTVKRWTPEERAAVRVWAVATAAQAPEIPARPAVLGTAHVAADAWISEAEPGDTYQACRECGVRLVSKKTGSDEEVLPYPGGTLVGTDCQGAQQPARYTKRRKKNG